MLERFTEADNSIGRLEKHGYPSDIDQIAQGILADMPLKEKAAIANPNQDKDPYHHLWDKDGLA